MSLFNKQIHTLPNFDNIKHTMFLGIFTYGYLEHYLQHRLRRQIVKLEHIDDIS